MIKNPAKNIKQIKHETAKPTHYNQEAKTYDLFNEKNSQVINQTIEKILSLCKTKSVLDMTCGTGSQVFYLAKRGYKVTGSDINKNMLRIAKAKNKSEKRDIKFIQGDIRSLSVGKFDAVLSIFNAVGHLTKNDFLTAMRNVRKNLNRNGLYIFDIFNLNYFLHGNHITQLTIDWQEKEGVNKNRIIQYSTVDHKGILTSYTTVITQKENGALKTKMSAQTLQIYNAKQLNEMLQKAGFIVLHYLSVTGKKFDDTKTDRLLVIAKASS